VKTRTDPTNVLPRADYSTVLKVGACVRIVQLPLASNAKLQVSASGMSVQSPADGQAGSLDPNVGIERFFWVYTDFYKWSLLSQYGKLALQINVFADEVCLVRLAV
jgi:hypothetical protein